jgi:hypothetical protein
MERENNMFRKGVGISGVNIVRIVRLEVDGFG